MTAPVPPEAVEAAMEALLERYGLGADDSDAERIAAAVVAALDLPGREREAAAKALDEAADEFVLQPSTWLYRRWLRARATALREGRES